MQTFTAMPLVYSHKKAEKAQKRKQENGFLFVPFVASNVFTRLQRP
jgi:hypothetical protein